MVDVNRGQRPQRSRLGAQVDAMTWAALTVAALLLAGTVVMLGGAASADRIGCGLNATVNSMMAYPRPCYAPARTARP